MDLVFPHHENEIAQSRALGHDFARIWMHNGMLSMGGEEMHKSAGNAVLLTEVLDRFGRETVLLFFMTGAVAEAARLLGSDPDRGEGAGRDAPQRASRGETALAATGTRSPQRWRTTSTRRRRSRSCTSGRGRAPSRSSAAGSTCSGSGSLAERAQAPPEVVALAEARIGARASRDFAEADRLRDEIAAHGWEVRDVAAGYELVPRA